MLRTSGWVLALGLTLGALTAWAGFNNGNGFQQAVGGISIDAEGVVKNATVDTLNKVAEVRRAAIDAIPGGLDEKVALRKISLKRLGIELQKCLDKNAPIPDEIQVLGGLTRVQYVFVYPELQDIVVAGPAEGWKVDDAGNVIGKTSGKPVLLLDDLLVALRVAMGNQPNITCSIDPQAEGVARLMQFVKAQEKNLVANPAAAADAIEQVVGPQKITFNGVPTDSHYAAVLLAADYRMKRIGMGLEKSPVAGMPSFMELSNGAATNLFPRWWLTTSYDALKKSPAGDAWELRGSGVKAMTEDAFFAANGQRTTTGKTSPIAQKWADSLNGKYEELSGKLPIFAELRNAMDLAVVATLIVRENLPEKAGFNIEGLASPTIPTAVVNSPKEVPSEASFVRKNKNIVISVSGGIDIRMGDVVSKQEADAALAPIRTQAAPEATTWQWWWN